MIYIIYLTINKKSPEIDINMEFISFLSIICDTARCTSFNCNLLLYAYDLYRNPCLISKIVQDFYNLNLYISYIYSNKKPIKLNWNAPVFEYRSFIFLVAKATKNRRITYY